jgi:hypothetical protein
MKSKNIIIITFQIFSQTLHVLILFINFSKVSLRIRNKQPKTAVLPDPNKSKPLGYTNAMVCKIFQRIFRFSSIHETAKRVDLS